LEINSTMTEYYKNTKKTGKSKPTGNKHYIGKKVCISVSIGLLALSYGCANPQTSPNESTGAAVGAISGAILGHQIDHDHGALFGAAIGAIAGSSIGRYQDEQQRALERALRQERRRKDIEIQRLQDQTLQVSLSSEACFDFDKSEIKPAFYLALDNLAEQLNHYNKTILHIIGHTDNVGSNEYNYALSIRRAKAVAQYLSFKGVSTNRLRVHGRGEQQPRAGNNSPDNRQFNRRVEIYIKPIVAGREHDSLTLPPHVRQNPRRLY